ncbi:MAG TPA: sigma-70 family RNA polymerase sigma factor [Baekduia sp.]|nr:sigma-70 family RNA polymerase sigma factor [Baekduia sp.]
MPMVAEAQREEVLLRRFAATRDPELREELVRRYLPLARHAAGRYARSSQAYEDLFQIAVLGLVKAVDRYDPGRAGSFSTYALPTMTGELRRHFRDRTWAVRPPRGLQEHAMAVERATEALSRESPRAPSVAQLARHTGLPERAVLEAREALAARHAVSFAAPSGGDDAGTVEDRIGVEDRGLRRAEDRAVLQAAQRVLTAREREIVRLRFDEDLTQRDIGRRVGISQMQVSRILRGAIDKLRAVALGEAP